MKQSPLTENETREYEATALAREANSRSAIVKELGLAVRTLAQSHRMLARAHANCPDADELARLRAVADAARAMATAHMSGSGAACWGEKTADTRYHSAACITLLEAVAALAPEGK